MKCVREFMTYTAGIYIFFVLLVVLGHSISFAQGSLMYTTRELQTLNKQIDRYDRGSARALHNMGWIEELEGNEEKALKYYEEAARRSPKQVHTFERMGELYYKQGSFGKAIVAGEHVLKLDPLNQEVVKWLPDAYAQRFKMQQKVVKKIKKKKQEEKIAKAVKEERKKRKTLTIVYEGTVRTAYELQGDKGYGYESTPGFGPNYPHMLYVDFMPFASWQLLVSTGNPCQGALMPNVVHWTEKIESIFHRDNYFLGIGFLGSHYYKGTNIFGEEETLNDYKIGIILGKYWEQSRLGISIYPRFIPYDAGYKDNRTLDVETLDVTYKYTFSSLIGIYTLISLNGYYFFDHELEISHYEGYDDFTIGVTFNDSPESVFVVSLDFTERVYFEKTVTDHPYAFGNGQGWFGIDRYNWFKGDPLSGFKAVGHVIAVKFEERIGEHFFLYQKFMAEFVRTTQEQHDFCLQLGIGGRF